jgi:hypothetical protein
MAGKSCSTFFITWKFYEDFPIQQKKEGGKFNFFPNSGEKIFIFASCHVLHNQIEFICNLFIHPIWVASRKLTRN